MLVGKTLVLCLSMASFASVSYSADMAMPSDLSKDSASRRLVHHFPGGPTVIKNSASVLRTIGEEAILLASKIENLSPLPVRRSKVTIEKAFVVSASDIKNGTLAKTPAFMSQEKSPAFLPVKTQGSVKASNSVVAGSQAVQSETPQ